jgi:hypothetical protein
MPATIHPTSASRSSAAMGGSAGADGMFDWLTRMILLGAVHERSL